MMQEKQLRNYSKNLNDIRKVVNLVNEKNIQKVQVTQIAQQWEYREPPLYVNANELNKLGEKGFGRSGTLHMRVSKSSRSQKSSNGERFTQIQFLGQRSTDIGTFFLSRGDRTHKDDQISLPPTSGCYHCLYLFKL